MALSIHHNQHQPEHGLSSFSTFFIVCSVLIYIICHTFNVSPSILLQTSKFWFFVSNTLILIIAIDSGVFSSASSSSSYGPPDHDHDQLAVLIPAIPTFEQGSTFQQHEEATSKSSGVPVIGKETKNSDAIEFKSLSIVTQIDEQEEVHEKRVINEESPSLTISNTKHDDEALEINRSSELDLQARSFGPSKSERIVRAITHDDDQDKNVLHRSRTDKYEPADCKKNYQDIDEQFSNMSNEELNRRVEEFISKFKKQQFRLEGSDNKLKRKKKSYCNKFEI